MSKNVNKVFSQLKVVETITAATKTLNLYDTGKTFFLAPAAAQTITLPSLTTSTDNLASTAAPPGWNCTLVLTQGDAGTAGGMDYKIDIDFGSGKIINGQVFERTSDFTGDLAVTGDDFIQCTAAASPGDRIEVLSDGSIWHVIVHCNDVAAVLFGAAAQ